MKNCEVIIDRDRKAWTDELFKLPSNEQILFIEEAGFPSQAIAIPSKTRKGDIDIFLLFAEEGYPTDDLAQKRRSFIGLNWDTKTNVSLHIVDLESKEGEIYAKKRSFALKNWKDLPHITKTYRIYPFKKDGKRALIIQKYYSKGTLKSFLLINPKLKNKQKIQLIRDILLMLEQLHKKNWIHNYLDANRIYIEKEGDLYRAFVGALDELIPLPQKDWGPYMRPLNRDEPPELFYFTYGSKGRELISSASDVWRVGIILRVGMLHQRMPWAKHSNPLDLYRAMRDENFHPEPTEKNSLEHLAWQMTRPVLTERITVEDALKKLQEIDE